MITALNKISLSKFKPLLVFLLLFLFFSLSVGKEQLHNHKPNEPGRNDCPALIISQSFSSGITVHFEFPAFQTVESYFTIPNYSKPATSKLFTTNLRAPPKV